MLKKIGALYYSGERVILCGMLLAMIFLACLQIILRTAFSSGLLWIDPLLRYLVLWSGLLGASMATSQGKHIALDLSMYILPRKSRPWIALCSNLFSTLISGCLTWASYLFIRDEYAYGGSGLLGLPSWGWNIIFPAAFFLITTHFLIEAVKTVLILKKSLFIRAQQL